jgi:hypothetical protein
MGARMRAVVGMLGCMCVLSLSGCGGGSDTPTAPKVTPTPTPLPPPQVVAQGTGLSLESEFVGRVPITTTRAGSLKATVDWTFATNDIDVALVRSNCTFDQFTAAQCQILSISASATAKPEVIQADGAAAGDYTLFIENTGPADETLSFQVVLTPSATASAPPSASTRAGGPGSLGLKRQPRGSIDLR